RNKGPFYRRVGARARNARTRCRRYVDLRLELENAPQTGCEVAAAADAEIRQVARDICLPSQFTRRWVSAKRTHLSWIDPFREIVHGQVQVAVKLNKGFGGDGRPGGLGKRAACSERESARNGTTT